MFVRLFYTKEDTLRNENYLKNEDNLLIPIMTNKHVCAIFVQVLCDKVIRGEVGSGEGANCITKYLNDPLYMT